MPDSIITNCVTLKEWMNEFFFLSSSVKEVRETILRNASEGSAW